MALWIWYGHCGNSQQEAVINKINNIDSHEMDIKTLKEIYCNNSMKKNWNTNTIQWS